MGDKMNDLNVVELLMGIKEDVSAIKTDVSNFKEAQKNEREIFYKEISDVRADYKRDLKSLESTFMSKFSQLQTVQNKTVGEVDTLQNDVIELKHADDKKDATKWKTVIAFIGTSIGSMFLIKLPEIIAYFLKAGGNK